MNKLIILISALILASLACLETTSPIAEKNETTVTTQTAMQDQEPDSGAVFELDTWNLTPETRQSCAIVTAIQSLHLRTEPSEKSKVLDYLYNGEQVTLLAKEADWWTIRAGDQTGWARAEYLAESECK